MERAPAKPRRSILLAPILWLLALLCLAVLLVGPILKMVFRVTFPTRSMEPTLPQGSVVSGERFSYLFGSPRRNDLVMFRTEGLPGFPQDQLYIKRVIGLLGESLKIEGGQLFINGTNIIITNAAGPITFPTHEPFDKHTDIKLAPDEHFVIGDNTTNSHDSRTFGPVPRKNIEARIVGP